MERLNHHQAATTASTVTTAPQRRTVAEKGMVETVLKSAAGREIGRQLVRGLFGMLFGGRRR